MVDPRVIVLLGATALTRLLPHRKKVPMKEVVGKPFTDEAFPGRTFLVFFHPAYLLRDPRQRPQARQHIATLAGLVGPRNP
jgi:uracil-DNA glycosylase family 4